MRVGPSDALAPRWGGGPGRLEVWYATLSDPASQTGCWVHHEVVSPVVGEPYAHGWAAVFAPDAAPVLERFGPVPAHPGGSSPLTDAGTAVLDPPRLRGAAGRLAWDLAWGTDVPAPAPLFTFPAWAWERQVLPAAQVVAVPSAPWRGRLQVDDRRLELSDGARGNVAHIYGHGNAQRWGWLHAELGGGDVLEIVSAVGRRRVLRHLPPLALVQLRLDGHDWPRDPLVAAPLFRTGLGLPTWTVAGTVGNWRLRVSVTVPEHASVRVGYVDPDGADATCTNSAWADAEVVLERRRAGSHVVRRWTLAGSAHAEVGTRP